MGDTFLNAEALRRYGSGWFAVGDADLATHLRRTARLRAGQTLSEATAELVRALGVPARVLPMSDDRVRTLVDTDDGRLTIQEYLVRRRAAPTVRSVTQDGLDRARPAPRVLDAVADADLVVIAPSNPVSSIAPIVSLPGVRDALVSRPTPPVAVTPVVTGQAPVTGPERSRAHVRAAFLAARGLDHRATDAARCYAGIVRGFVLDERDAGEREGIERLGMAVRVLDTLAPPAARAALAEAVVRFGDSLAGCRA